MQELDGNVPAVGGVQHVVVGQGELHNVAGLELARAVLDVQNAVIGRTAQHDHALVVGHQALHIAHVGAAETQNTALAVAAI